MLSIVSSDQVAMNYIDEIIAEDKTITQLLLLRVWDILLMSDDFQFQSRISGYEEFFYDNINEVCMHTGINILTLNLLTISDTNFTSHQLTLFLTCYSLVKYRAKNIRCYFTRSNKLMAFM